MSTDELRREMVERQLVRRGISDGLVLQAFQIVPRDEALFALHGPHAKGIVWEHNSHVGDARATEMTRRGELNVGELCRESYAEEAYIVGFGTDHGTVAAASLWGGPPERKRVRPAHELSYESALP